MQNGTSLAVVSLTNGDKRFFFQEGSGSVRGGVYTSANKQWIADTNNVVASDAKNSTPLAALLVNGTGTSANTVCSKPSKIRAFQLTICRSIYFI